DLHAVGVGLLLRSAAHAAQPGVERLPELLLELLTRFGAVERGGGGDGAADDQSTGEATKHGSSSFVGRRASSRSRKERSPRGRAWGSVGAAGTGCRGARRGGARARAVLAGGLAVALAGRRILHVAY